MTKVIGYHPGQPLGRKFVTLFNLEGARPGGYGPVAQLARAYD